MIATLLFWGFSLLLLGSALLVITLQNPVKSVLCLVLCFFAATALWLLLSAEFLALILILVYVGAVMTLFLFVVMTLPIDADTLRSPYLRFYLPIGLFVTALIAALLIYALHHTQLPLPIISDSPKPIANVNALGDVLYTQYALPFEIAAVILLTAMIAAISLTLYDPIKRKQQSIDAQVKVKREDRVRLVK